MDKRKAKWSISGIFIMMVISLVAFFSIAIILIFVRIYRNSMEQNAIITSEQSCVQVVNTIESYTDSMEETMNMILEHMEGSISGENDFVQNLVEVENDIVAVTAYDKDGERIGCWSNGLQLKENAYCELSYVRTENKTYELNITKPHVTSIFQRYYPWVVTLYEHVRDSVNNEIEIAMDIRFSSIANYIDDVGIGQHGYCYIADEEGNLIYHPQQQLIYSGLKGEASTKLPEGAHIGEEAIYTVRHLENCNWKVVTVCYVDEMVTEKVMNVVFSLLVFLSIMLVVIFLLGWAFSALFTSPVKKLAVAMKEFENQAENFEYEQVMGTLEIQTLSDSFGHMVVRIQDLMDQVRQEEINLRKVELKALQAQINPHFLYNTLDAIAWLCEEGRNKDAAEMVTSLARLFRISISRGHELITIEKELEHAKSYLKIQSYRYKNQFIYEFDVDETCLPYMCNKITLQPIIENAIYHGVKQMVDEGEIHIRVYAEGQDIIFQVEDNGIGMTKEQCQRILQNDESDQAGIGIKNVNDRIKIYFGEKYGLWIESELDQGTCVTIRMPKLEKAI